MKSKTTTEDDDRIFKELSEGFPPSMIDGIKDYDFEEVVQFLVTYHLNKMSQVEK